MVHQVQPDGLAGVAGVGAGQPVPAADRPHQRGIPLEALRYRLRTAELLLVLDNCEHLLDACAGIAMALLRSASGLRVLATSREPLGIAGEATYLVPPLAVPAERAETAALARAPAVRLFLERASAAYRGAGVAATTIATVARICRELDGLPLAIELAAARTTALSAEEIETHLADKFRFLAYRRPAADTRHQALKAAIDWSYELLSAEERDTFRQLSVFAGGFRLAEAAAVCCDGDQAAALDMIDRLTSKSLVIAEMAAGKTRYRLLETVRQYAAARLAEEGEADQARSRHAAAFLRLAEGERDLAALSREHDNFRAALEYTLPGGGQGGPRLTRALGGYWLARGFLQEGRGWLERALAGEADRRLRADLLRLLGAMLYETGDLDRAQAALSEGSRIAAE
jgi:non-specific serine/threonine protein kinase